MKQFYEELYLWVETVNRKKMELPDLEFWDFVYKSAGDMTRKYNHNALVTAIMKAHVHFLVDQAEEAYKDKLPF